MPLRAWPGACATALLTLAQPALANPTDTCVETRSDIADPAELRKLVTIELDRHATHRAVERECLSFLRVELIEIAGSRYVTGRINTQVPHRQQVIDGDLASAIEDVLAILLNNDPVRLRGPRRGGWIRQQLTALRGGRTAIGLELYQLGTAASATGLQTLPGLAIGLRREVAHWQLEARVAFAARLDAPTDLHLTWAGALQLGLRWYAGLGDTAFYLGAYGGLDALGFSGPSAIDGTPKDFTALSFALGARAGLELLRTTRLRLDLFTQLSLPVTPIEDEDEGVVDGWFPTATLGLGAVF